MLSSETNSTIDSLTRALQAWVERAVVSHGGSTVARKPGNRTKFHWPPCPVSYSFHVLASDWTGHANLEVYGERFAVSVARTPNGVFGRCKPLWLECRGETDEEMLQNMAQSAEPLFHRQLAISRCLEQRERFTGHIRDLEPLQLIQLLYCDDRDVANDSRTEIETKASDRVFLPLLLTVIRDRRHPNRRSAQWCVLDLFEDLPSFCETPSDESTAVAAIKDLIWDAEDDYARTIYKAGVVLGGHLPYDFGGPVLLECLTAPSKIGRRSAIHGLFHVVEWVPEMRPQIVHALQQQSNEDPDQLLREFARQMALDIEAGNFEHVVEPIFPDEL